MSVAHLSAGLASWTLFAATGRRGNQIGQRVDDSGFGSGILYIAVAIAVIAIVSLIVWGVFKWRRRHAEMTYTSVKGMFQELCRAHELSIPDRQLLRDLAEWHKLTNPAQIFIDPAYFDLTSASGNVATEKAIERLKTTLFTIQSAPLSP